MAQATRDDVAEALKQVLQQEFPGHTFQFTPILYDPDSFVPYSGLVIDRQKSKIRLNIKTLDSFTINAEIELMKELLKVLGDEVERHFKSNGIKYHRRGQYDLAIGSKVELQ